MKKHVFGFSTVEILLAIFLVGLIGFAGWYVWDNNNEKSDDTQQNTNQSQTNQQKTSSKSELTESSASKTVIDFYEKYIALDPPGNYPTQEAFIKQYGTDNLLTYFNNDYNDGQEGVDPIVCAQADASEYKVVGTTVQGDMAVVKVEAVYSADAGNIKITANVVEDDGLRVDSITCEN